MASDWQDESVIGADALCAFEHGALSPREAEAAKSALLGMTAEEASHAMAISPSSVGNYRARAYRKLGVRNSRELVERFGGCVPDVKGAAVSQDEMNARLHALGLGPAQVPVAMGILADMTTREIARRLSVAEGTVSSNRSRIYMTLGVHSKEELADLVSQVGGEKGAGQDAGRRRVISKKVAFLAMVALACAALLFGTWRLTHSRTINGVVFPVNVAGHSYGDFSDARVPTGVTGRSVLDYCPDMVKVSASNGREGYADADKVLFRGSDPVPVYEASGLQVIGSL